MSESNSNQTFELRKWEKVDIESAKFTLQQGEKNLSELIKGIEILNQRSVTILRFFIPLTIIFIGYIATNFKTIDLAVQLSIYGAIYSFTVILLAFKVYDLYNIRPVGNKPINTLTDDEVKMKNTHLVLLYDAIRSNQRGINYNQQVNAKMASKIKILFNVIKWGLSFPFIYTIAYIICHP